MLRSPTGGKLTSDTSLFILYKQNDDKFWVWDYGSSKPDSTSIKRYTANGFIDPSFGQNGELTLGFSIAQVAEQQNGDFIITGYSSTWSSTSQAMYRLHKNGVLDSTFGTAGKTRLSANWITVQENSKILAGGMQHDRIGNSKLTLTRFTADGRIDSTFGGGGPAVTDIDLNATNSSYQGEILKTGCLFWAVPPT